MPRIEQQTACDNPKVSVCMITYNHEKFIAQAIESVLMQETDFPVELIIGEDCSTDGTRRVVMEYARRNPNVIRTILHDRNVGMNKNADSVELACQGKYVALLEGDDYWTHPQKLQKQVQLMDAHPHYSMCGSIARTVIFIAEGDETEGDRIQPKTLKATYDLTDVFEGLPMHTSNVMLRRGLVVIPSWMNELIIRDFCLFALHAEKGPVGYLNEVTSTYRLHSGGVWTGKSLFDRLRWQLQTSDFLDAHFRGKHHRLLRLWEYREAMGAYRRLAMHGMFYEATKVYKEAFSRLIRLIPMKILVWGLGLYVGDRCSFAWNRFTMFLAIRTRLRHISRRLGPCVGKNLY